MLAEDRRRALEAAAAGRRGARADAAMALLWALVAAQCHLGDQQRRRAVWGYIAAAFVRCMDASPEEQAGLERQGASLEQLVTDLSVMTADMGWSDSFLKNREDRLALLRTVATTVSDPFDDARLRELLAS